MCNYRKEKMIPTTECGKGATIKTPDKIFIVKIRKNYQTQKEMSETCSDKV